MSPRRLVFCLLALSAPAWTALAAGTESRRVLFIGNSLTAWNDLPAIVAAMAKAAGQPRLEWEAVLLSGSNLEDQWNAGRARRAIGDGAWEVVVLQQGPSALAESRANLIEYAGKFAKEIRRIGARPALYMVWPSAARSGDFDRVCESYRLAAREVDGLLLPAGEAWKSLARGNSRIALYSPDGLHPTVAGSYLAALVIFSGLYGRSPVGLPPRLVLDGRAEAAVDLPPSDAARLQEAAAQAIDRSGGDPRAGASDVFAEPSAR